jgi:hypothetical protein
MNAKLLRIVGLDFGCIIWVKPNSVTIAFNKATRPFLTSDLAEVGHREPAPALYQHLGDGNPFEKLLLLLCNRIDAGIDVQADLSLDE